MIIKYNNYIKENININNFKDILHNILLELQEECKNDLFKDSIEDSYKIVSPTIGEYAYIYAVNSNYIQIEFHLHINYKISCRRHVDIYYNNPDFKKILKDKLILSYFFKMLFNVRYDTTVYNIFEECNMNINDDIYSAFEKILKNKNYNDILIHLIECHYLPLFIENKYKYLLNAKKFDLI